MKLLEHIGKKIFSQYGISIPEGYVVKDSSQVKSIEKPVAIKAQVLTGGRGKKGGVKFSNSTLDARHIVSEMLRNKINDCIVKEVLIEEKLRIAKELYISVFLDRNRGLPLIMLSPRGGIDIESVKKENIFSTVIDPVVGLQMFIVRNLIQKLDLPKSLREEIIKIIFKLYKIFKDHDAEMVEINPLVITEERIIVAADAKIIIDDNAIYRHPQFQEIDRGLTDFEQKGLELGVTAVELEGNIGIVTSGAGLQMATVDAVKFHGGTIGAAIDLAGTVLDSTSERMTEVLLLLENLKINTILFNFFLQTARCDTLAKSISNSLSDLSNDISIVIRLKGNKVNLAKKILSNKNFFLTESIEDAIAESIKRSNKERG